MNRASVPCIVCCTSNSVLAEPRAPKFTAALSNLLPDAKIVLIDASPDGQMESAVGLSGGTGTIHRKTCWYPIRRTGLIRALFAKIEQVFFRYLYCIVGKIDVRAMSIVAHGIRRQVELEQFDLVLGHSVDTLPSICDAARARGAKVVFDSMEFHSDMGEGQGRLARQLVQTIESKYLPRCDLVLTSSPEMAQALRSLYGLKAVLPVYNAAPITKKLRSKVDDGRLHLYWRNSTVGLSQRGLDDALRALSTLPDDIILNIQGRPGRGMSSLKKRISDLDIEHRAILHDAYPLGDAVLCASPYSIGLCLERDVCENHRLTVSNKIFDYLMAGLAVVCSNLPGLASVLDEADAGLLFEPGSVEELAAAIRYLYENQERLKQLQNNARTYAMTRVNEESELSRFGDEIRQLGFQR